MAIASSAWSAGCVLASPWIAHVTRCAASLPPWSRSSPPRTKTGACDWRRSTTPCSMNECGLRCWCCSPPWGWCCSSRVRTWRTCCWQGGSLVSANWPCARRWAPDAHASFASSSRRVSASRSSAARAVSCWRSLRCRPCGSCCRPRCRGSTRLTSMRRYSASACSCRSRAASSWGWFPPCAHRASPWCRHSRSTARGSAVPRERWCDTPSSLRRWPSRRCCSWVRRCFCRVSSGCSTSAPGSIQKA